MFLLILFAASACKKSELKNSSRTGIDATSLIVNPSFEANVEALAIGWTYGHTATYAWHTVNTGGDATKDGNNTMGLWNNKFADDTVYQTILVTNGIFKVSAYLTVPSGMLTTQRIFINDHSVLYGHEADYTAATLNVLRNNFGEKITFAGHDVHPSTEGPFLLCEATDTVTNGIIKLGVKINGTASAYSATFNFPNVAGNGFFKVDNFHLTYYGKP